MKIFYPATVQHDTRDNRYLVSFPDLPEAITEGTSLEEALFNASDVLTLTLEARIDEKMTIPAPSQLTKETYSIYPCARTQAALLIKFARATYSIADIAHRMETSWPAAARLENPHHWPSLRQLERAAHVIGQRLTLSLEPTHQGNKDFSEYPAQSGHDIQ